MRIKELLSIIVFLGLVGCSVADTPSLDGEQQRSLDATIKYVEDFRTSHAKLPPQEDYWAWRKTNRDLAGSTWFYPDTGLGPNGYIVVTNEYVVTVWLGEKSVVYSSKDKRIEEPTWMNQPGPVGYVLTVAQIQAAIQKAGGEKPIGKEAAKAISHFGNRDAPYTRDLTNCPAVTEFAALIDGSVLGVWPGGGDLPAHVRIRRGSHSNYQFIYIFTAGTAPATNSLKLQPVSGSVYLRNTSEGE